MSEIKIEPFPGGSHKNAGSYDRAGRWYPHDEYRVLESFKVRSPSRAWPSSYLKHFYTKKYARLLFEHRPDLYAGLHNIDQIKEPRKYMKIMKIPKTSRLGKKILTEAGRYRILKSIGLSP